MVLGAAIGAATAISVWGRDWEDRHFTGTVASGTLLFLGLMPLIIEVPMAAALVGALILAASPVLVLAAVLLRFRGAIGRWIRRTSQED